MPRLKDYLESDLDVFFNPDEVGEFHNIDGEDILVIIDNDLIEERQKNAQQNFNDPTGIYKADVLFAVKKTDFGEKPAVGENIMFDNRLYQVSDTEDEGNTYIITMVANRS